MLYTFRSKAAGEILMLPKHARPLLEVAGKLPDVAAQPRGVFTPDQLDAAIARLEARIQATPPATFNEDDPEDMARARQHVDLDQRAFPLLDMLRKARTKGVDVMWEYTG